MLVEATVLFSQLVGEASAAQVCDVIQRVDEAEASDGSLHGKEDFRTD